MINDEYLQHLYQEQNSDSAYHTFEIFLRNNFRKVKIHGLPVQRVGHLALNTELYLRRLEIQRRMGEVTFDNICHLFFCISDTNFIANQQLLKMIQRKLFVSTDPYFFKYCADQSLQDNQFWDFGCTPVTSELFWTFGDFELPMFSNEHTDWNMVGPQLSFLSEEMEEGNKLLRTMGVPLDAPFVCLHCRDKAYMGVMQDSQNYSYHNYRDSDILNYMDAAQFLANQGYYVLRMGQSVEKPFISDNPRIIDYATKYRTDFGDIFLPAHCKFFLGSTSGIVVAAQIFNIPSARANWVPLGVLPLGNTDIFIPKKLWVKNLNRFLTLKEIVQSGLHMAFSTEHYHKVGVEVVENTADEICEIAQEMHERISGKFFPTEEDILLQSIFQYQIATARVAAGAKAQIGNVFLKKNLELFRMV